MASMALCEVETWGTDMFETVHSFINYYGLLHDARKCFKAGWVLHAWGCHTWYVVTITSLTIDCACFIGTKEEIYVRL